MLRLILVLVCCLALIVLAKKDKPQVVKAELPHIACQVCERLSTQIYDGLVELKAQTKKRRISESAIEDMLEGLCLPEQPSGYWIRRLDIVEGKEGKNVYLSLAEPGGMTKCKNECATIAKSCEKLLQEEQELDDLLFFIWEKTKNDNELPTRDAIKKYMCSDSGEQRCKKKPVPFSSTGKQRKPRADELFSAQTQKEIEMEELIVKMGDMGQGMRMMDRDSMMNELDEEMMAEMEENYGGGGDFGMGGEF
jgi:hypothetical protein